MVNVDAMKGGESRLTKDQVIQKFCKWWTREELTEIIIPKMSSLSTFKLISKFAGLDQNVLLNHEKLANILYEIVGSKFLRNNKFLPILLEAATKNDDNYKNQIITKAKEFFFSVTLIEHVSETPKSNRWVMALATLLDLPLSCGWKDRKESPPSTEEIIPHVNLNPLYDYQYTIGRQILDMLEGRIQDKRAMICVPTGAGKTRLVVETLIEWINEGKKGKPNSPFILWIAQSNELCDQAFSTFKDVFLNRGKRNTSLRLHRFWGSDSSLPDLSQLLEEDGVIVATIQSLHNSATSVLNLLSDLTGVIIIDEAHHSTARSYTEVLDAMGFNFRLTAQEPSQKGIVLLGLTATPFRGSGNNPETERLRSRYGKFLWPEISDSALAEKNQEPHALIDCQNYAESGEFVRINGNKSYDKDGYIESHSWTISKKVSSDTNDTILVYGPVSGKHFDKIDYRFIEEGDYTIKLVITDNEGDQAEQIKILKIGPKKQEADVPDHLKMKYLFRKLVNRKILCNVFHEIIKTDESVLLTQTEEDYLTEFKELSKTTIKKLGEDFLRNYRIIKRIHALKNQNEKKSILFFACSVEHARDISLVLNACLGMNSKYVVSDMDLQDRLEAIEEFKDGKIEVLCNYGILTTGFDAPNIDCVFVGRPTMSTLLYTQMVGRGLRGTKTGGTQDCLIIDIDDNFQLHDRGEAEQLGWKNFQEFWIEVEPFTGYEELESIAVKDDIVKEVEKLIHVCPKCNTKASGFFEISEFFGLSNKRKTSSNPYGIQSYCRSCRSTKKQDVEIPLPREIEPKTDFTLKLELDNLRATLKNFPQDSIQYKKAQERIEDITKLFGTHDKDILPQIANNKKSASELMNFIKSDMKMESNYQPIMLIQLIKNGPSDKKQIAEVLAQTNNSNDIQYFMKVPVYDVLERRGFVTFDEESKTYEIDVNISEIERPEILLELEQKIASAPQVKFESKHKVVLEHYNKLKNELGFAPTSRMYSQSNPLLPLEFITQQFGSYFNFITQQGDDPRLNEKLRELLYDNYFSLFIKLGKKLSTKDITEHSLYKASDYEECFGSFENFQATIEPILENLKKIAEPLFPNQLEQDYLKVRRILGHSPSFDELRYNSDLGIEYYIVNFGSYSEFKKSLHVEEKVNKSLTDLKNDYYRIKNELGAIPSYTQMCKYSRNALSITKLYGAYNKFLESIGEVKENISQELALKKKKELEDQFNLWVKSRGPYVALERISSQFRIPYQEWFGTLEDFIEECRPTLLPIYQKMKEQRRRRNMPNNIAKIPGKSEKVTLRDIFPEKSEISNLAKFLPKIITKFIPKTGREKSKIIEPEGGWKKCPKCNNIKLTPLENNRKFCTDCGWDSDD